MWKPAEPDQRSGRHGRLGCHPPLGTDPAREAPDETGQPETVLALATDIAVVDHVSGSVWLIANAVNVDDKSTRADAAYNEAVARLDQMQRDAATPAPDESRATSWTKRSPNPSCASAPRRATTSRPSNEPSSTSSTATCSRWSSPSASTSIRLLTRSTCTVCCAR